MRFFLLLRRDVGRSELLSREFKVRFEAVLAILLTSLVYKALGCLELYSGENLPVSSEVFSKGLMAVNGFGFVLEDIFLMMFDWIV